MSIKELKPINLVFYSKWDSYEKWRNVLLKQNIKCDYLIIGAGYTGLSAARKLSEINSDKSYPDISS